MPRLEAAYDAYIKAGHNPWDANSPLAKKNVDALIDQIRPKQQMDQERLSDPDIAHDPDARPASVASESFLPPPPRNVDWQGWQSVVSRPPQAAGKPNYAFWATQLNKLIADPTPQMVHFFNERYGKFGYDGEEVLRALQVRPVMPTPAPPSRPPHPLDAPAPAPEPDLGRAANAIRSFNHWLSGHEQQYGPMPETVGQKIGDFLMRRGSAGA